MNNKSFLRPVLLSAGLLFTGVSAAGSLRLDEAVTHALAHNPELRAAHTQAAAASEARAAADAGHWPRLDLQYQARRSDNPLDAFADKLNRRVVNPATDFSASALNQPDASTLHATELSLTLPLYTGGRTSAQAREAGNHESAARHHYQRAREFTVYRTTAAYFHAQAAAAGVAIADDALNAARLHADTTARLARERRIVASDRLNADVNLAMIQSQREQAASRAALSLNQLKLAMGVALDAEMTPLAWEDPLPGPAPEPLAAHEARALASRADLRAQEAAVAAARARIDQARSVFKPQVGVVAGESWYDDKAELDNSSTRVMGVVSLNLYNGGRDSHQLAGARLAVEEQEQRLEALRAQARVEVRAAWQALTEARARVEICADNVGKARDTVTQVRARYGEGRTILIDLLAAERTLVEARSEKLAAALHRKVAEAQLQLATGGLESAPGAAP
jgi:outer membrane protein TolC